jgi:hypothetical protein
MFVKLVFLSRFAMRRKSRKKFTVFVCLFVCLFVKARACVCACAIQYRIIGFAFAPLCLEVGGDVFDGTPKIIVCLTRLPIFSQHRSFQERKFIFPIFFKEKSPGLDTFFKQNNKFECPFWVFNFVCLNY